MSLMKPHYVTHYVALFDGDIEKDHRETVEEGGVQFHRNGVVVLGHQGFGFSRPIKDVRFGGGCIANRSQSDQVLTIATPTGEEFRFRYVVRDHNWYRLVVVERAPSRLLNTIHQVRENIADYGPVLGVAASGFDIVLTAVKHLLWWTVCLLVMAGLGVWAVEGLVVCFISPTGLHPAAALIAVAFSLTPISLVGTLVLGHWAFTRGGRFYRVTLPAAFVVAIVVMGGTAVGVSAVRFALSH